MMAAKITFQEYQEAKGINASFLKACLQGAYQGYKYLHDKKEPSSEMIFGSALHDFILENTSDNPFSNRYYVMPSVDRRTKAGKEAYEKALIDAASKIILDQDDFAKITRISSSLFSNPDFLDLHKTSLKEDSWFSIMPDGSLFKGRVDLYDPSRKIITDIKTTRAADPHNFGRDFYSFGYDIQMLHYATLLNQSLKAYDELTSLYIVAIEKDSEQIAFYDVTKICHNSYTQNRYQRAINTALEVLTLTACPNKYPQYFVDLIKE